MKATKKQTKNAGKPQGAKARKTPKTTEAASAPKSSKTRERDPRLPTAGTTIVRPYKGKEIRVKVLADGFEYEGKPYRSLTGIALVVTGYPAISGPAFFRLTGTVADAPKPKQSKTKEKPAAAKDDATEPAAESASPTN